MTLLYTPIEEELRSSVRDLLADRAPWASVLKRTESDERYDPALWTSLARDTGVAGLAVAEADGGHGASWREVAIVAEELGRSVAGTPFLGSVVLATALAQALDDHELPASLASGAARATVVVELSAIAGGQFPAAVSYDGSGLTGSGLTGTGLTGTVRNVADALVADTMLVPAVGPQGPAIFAVAASAATCVDVISLDLTRPVADVSFQAASGTLLASGDAAAAALDHALMAGAVILASEQLGLAQRCLDLTVDYLKTRHQFGRQIGSFQALKHRCADLWGAITQARAVARYAVECLADGAADLPIAASLAQAQCGPVAVKAAEECVQMHGGIGFTWEHPAHLYLKRAKADSSAFGSASKHRARLGLLVDLPWA
jgi:alkylation response protein AidB-like acyl-CoA dehydrogenase